MAALVCVLSAGCGEGSSGAERLRPGLAPPSARDTSEQADNFVVPKEESVAQADPRGVQAQGSQESSLGSLPQEELSFVGDTASGRALFVTKGGLASTSQLGRLLDGYGSAVWSPDGMRAVVNYPAVEDNDGIAIDDPDAGLFVVDADGRELWRISPTGSRAAWSPDGQWIAYSDNGGECVGDSGGYVVYVVRADGSGMPLTIGGGIRPEWSPDGTRIMYSFITGPFTWGLAVFELDGGNAWTIDQYQFPGGPEGPPVGSQAGAWSPDGQEIAYTYGDEIHVVNADGTRARRLIGGDEYLYAPSWSPDGQWIAYEAGPIAGADTIRDGHELWVADATEGNSKFVAQIDRFSAVWSPDGSRIAYLTNSANASGVIMVVAPAGNEDPYAVSPADSGDLAWSQDGTRIAFSSRGDTGSNPEGDGEIFVVDVDGGNLIQVTDNASDDYMPEWVISHQEALVNQTTEVASSRPSDAEVEEEILLLGSPFEGLTEEGNQEEGCSRLLYFASMNEAGEDVRTIVPEILGNNQFMTTGIGVEELQGIIIALDFVNLIMADMCGNIYDAADAFKAHYYLTSLRHEIGYLLKEGENLEDLILMLGPWSTEEEVIWYCESEYADAVRRQSRGWRDLLLSQRAVALYPSEDQNTAAWIGETIASVGYLCDVNGEGTASGAFPAQYHSMLSRLEE